MPIFRAGHPQALLKAYFIDAVDQTNKLTCLFNPEQIPLEKEAVYGELNPIGWSQTTVQYAYTKSMPYSLDLVFSRIAANDLIGVEDRYIFNDLNIAARFFNYFVHGTDPGIAPNRIIFCCPNTVLTINVLRKFRVTYKRWFQNMTLAEFGVTVDLLEDRQAFQSSSDAYANGFLDSSIGSGTGR